MICASLAVAVAGSPLGMLAMNLARDGSSVADCDTACVSRILGAAQSAHPCFATVRVTGSGPCVEQKCEASPEVLTLHQGDQPSLTHARIRGISVARRPRGVSIGSRRPTDPLDASDGSAVSRRQGGAGSSCEARRFQTATAPVRAAICALLEDGGVAVTELTEAKVSYSVNGSGAITSLKVAGAELKAVSARAVGLLGGAITRLELVGNPALVNVSALAALTTLRHLDLSDNGITELPDLRAMPSLEFLYLSLNPIGPKAGGTLQSPWARGQGLPEWLGEVRGIRSFECSRCGLLDLPPSVAAWRPDFIQLDGNGFERLPAAVRQWPPPVFLNFARNDILDFDALGSPSVMQALSPSLCLMSVTS